MEVLGSKSLVLCDSELNGEELSDLEETAVIGKALGTSSSFLTHDKGIQMASHRTPDEISLDLEDLESQELSALPSLPSLSSIQLSADCDIGGSLLCQSFTKELCLAAEISDDFDEAGIPPFPFKKLSRKPGVVTMDDTSQCSAVIVELKSTNYYSEEQEMVTGTHLNIDDTAKQETFCDTFVHLDTQAYLEETRKFVDLITPEDFGSPFVNELAEPVLECCSPLAAASSSCSFPASPILEMEGFGEYGRNKT